MSDTLTQNDFYSIAFLPMCKPWYSYANETRLFNRIMRFLGMQLYSNNNIHYNNFKKLLPSIYKNFPFNLSHYELIGAGIRRADNSISPDRLPDNYRLRTLNCISELIYESHKLNIESNNSTDLVNIYSPKWQRNIDIVFIPHNKYHTKTILYLSKYLDKLKLTYTIADCSAIYRDEGVREVLNNTNIPHISISQLCFGDYSPKSVSVFNDWDKIITHPAIETAKKIGIIAMAIVEGVQDYNDMDTGRVRMAYKSCSHVITPCSFDLKYFNKDQQYIYEGGIPRIDILISESTKHHYSSNNPIVINSNFTYNVLVDKRDLWINEIIESCHELGYSYIISKHPADMGDFSKYNVTTQTMYEAIWDCSLFISRFSSGIIEAIAMDRPVIYYNPHNEKIDKFKDPMGAYYIANNKSELKFFIKETFNNLSKLKKNWPNFLKHHAGVTQNKKDSATIKVVNAINESILTHKMPSQHIRSKFGKMFSTYFQRHDDEIFKSIKELYNWNGIQNL